MGSAFPEIRQINKRIRPNKATPFPFFFPFFWSQKIEKKNSFRLGSAPPITDVETYCINGSWRYFFIGPRRCVSSLFFFGGGGGRKMKKTGKLLAAVADNKSAPHLRARRARNTRSRKAKKVTECLPILHWVRKKTWHLPSFTWSHNKWWFQWVLLLLLA